MDPAQQEPEVPGQVSVAAQGAPPEDPNPEELASAADVMQALVRTAKGLRIYLPNNPVLIRFVQESSGKLAAHLERFGDFKLEVDPFALRYLGAEVYQNQDPKESMAFRMHSDGIRLLLFSHGLGERELTVFLEIVGFERANYQDDDIVTRLWGQSLPHIAYLLEEDFCEIRAPEPEHTVAASQQGAITEIFADLARTPLHRSRMIPQHLLMLTKAEVSWLRKATQADAQRDPLDDVINILSAILAGVRDPEDFREFTGIMVRLSVDMFLAKELGHALRLVRFLDQLQALGSMPAERRELLAVSLAGILSESVLQSLKEAIDGGEAVSQKELKELLLIFGLPCLSSICELLGRLETRRMRKVLIEVLIELARDNPEVLATFLADPRWYLVRNLVLVLSLLDHPAALKMIVGLISHREARIRKEVLSFLEHSKDPKAAPYLLKFLRDESSPLRIRTLQILARKRAPFALRPVLALTGTEEFKTREIAEKKAVYEALGELGSEQMVPLFREMLLKKHWLRRTISRDSALCAVAGLLKVRHSSARLLLDEARKQGNPEFRTIIEQSIEAVAAESGKTAA